MILRDPQTGRGMQINEEGFGQVFVTGIPAQFRANWTKKTFYSAVIEKTPTGAGDCFFYIKNDDDRDLIVTSLKLQSASAENVQVKLGDSGTVGGTHAALLPVSRHAGSGQAAEATCESGVDITGLSGGSVVDLLCSSTLMVRWFWESRLVVPKNRIFSLYAVTGAVAIKASLSFYFCKECL